MPGIEGDGLGPVQWTPGEIQETQSPPQQIETPQDSITQAETGQPSVNVQLLLQKPNLSILEFATLMSEMYAEIQQLAYDTENSDTRAINRLNQQIYRQAAGLVLKSALHGVQSAFSQNQAANIDAKISDANVAFLTVNNQLSRMTDRDQEEYDALKEAIEEFNAAPEPKKQADQDALDQAVERYNTYVANRNALLDAMTNQANATIIDYNVSQESYNSAAEEMNQEIRAMNDNSIPEMPLANQILEPITSLGAPMASFSISTGPNGVALPALAGPTREISQRINPIYANNVSQSAESQLMGSIATGLNLVRTIDRVVDAIQAEIELSNRLLGLNLFSSRSFLQRMPDLFLNFSASGTNFGLASLAFGMNPASLQVAIAQSLLLEIATSTATPVPTLFFEQMQTAVLKLVAENALLSVMGALMILGKSAGRLNAGAHALDVALTLSLANRLNGINLNELVQGSQPLAAALRLTLSAHLINRFSFALGLPGLGAQVLSLVTGLSSSALIARVAIGNLVSSTLFNPLSQLSLKFGLSQVFSEFRGSSLADAQSLVNDVMNLVTGNYGTMTPAEIAYQMHLAFQARGENLLDSIFLTNTAMDFIFGDIGMNHLDQPFNPLFNRQEVIRAVIATGIITEGILSSAIDAAVGQVQQSSIRDFRDQLFLELYRSHVVRRIEAMYIANQVAGFVFSGQIAPLTGIVPERLESLVNLLGLAGLSGNVIRQLIDETSRFGPISTEEQFFVHLQEVAARYPDVDSDVIGQAYSDLTAGTENPLTHPDNNGTLDPSDLAGGLYNHIVNQLTQELGAEEGRRIANSVVVMVLGSVAQEGAAQGLLQQMQNELRTLQQVGNPQIEGSVARTLMDIFTSRSQHTLFNQLFQEPNLLLQTFIQNFGDRQDSVRYVGGA